MGSSAGHSAFVGGNSNADPRAADQNASIFRFYHFGHAEGVLGVVARFIFVCSHVDYLEFTSLGEIFLNSSFEGESSVVRTEKYSEHNMYNKRFLIFN